jgi:DNA-binding MurR/RpiR family transcriptional regulator
VSGQGAAPTIDDVYPSPRWSALEVGRAALLVIDLPQLCAGPGRGMFARAAELGAPELLEPYRRRLDGIVLPNVAALLACSREADVPVVFTRIESLTVDGSDRSRYHARVGLHVPPGAPDGEILEEVAPAPGEVVVAKTTSDAFIGTGLERLLRNLGAEQLVVGGVLTNECVESTVRHAADVGFEVILAEDACAAVESWIRESYAAFSPAESKIADLLLASPDLMVGFTATELAERAGVSKPTVTRFVSRLGLDGFREFRRMARETQRLAPGSPLDLLTRGLDVTEGDLGVLVAESLRRDVDNLERTYRGLDEDALEAVICRLVEAPRVVFVDFRKQYSLAYYAGTLFNSIRPDVRTLPVPGTSAADGMLDLGSDDLMVMFPFRRAQRDHAVTAEAAVELGMTLVSVGDRYPNRAAELAEVHLVCQTDGVGVFDSSVAPMSLINLLFTATATRLGVPAQQRLARLERAHHIFDTFLGSNGREPPRR